MDFLEKLNLITDLAFTQYELLLLVRFGRLR